jgi:hypothetical protein
MVLTPTDLKASTPDLPDLVVMVVTGCDKSAALMLRCVLHDSSA